MCGWHNGLLLTHMSTSIIFHEALIWNLIKNVDTQDTLCSDSKLPSVHNVLGGLVASNPKGTGRDRTGPTRAASKGEATKTILIVVLTTEKTSRKTSNVRSAEVGGKA